MPNLKKLKARLEKLPQRKAEGYLAATFGDYTQKVAQFFKKLWKTHQDMGYASKVYSSSDYDSKVLSELKKAVREAKKLHHVIEEDPQKATARATENKVVKLGDHASKANTQCRDIWNQEIEESIAKWEKIAGVVQDLGAKGGREFNQAVDSIRMQSIPQSDNEVDKVKAAQKALQKGIAGLGLEGRFGEFLKATVEGGASPKDLLDDEIRKKMDEHQLWDSFRVWLEK